MDFLYGLPLLQLGQTQLWESRGLFPAFPQAPPPSVSFSYSFWCPGKNAHGYSLSSLAIISSKHTFRAGLTYLCIHPPQVDYFFPPTFCFFSFMSVFSHPPINDYVFILLHFLVDDSVSSSVILSFLLSVLAQGRAKGTGTFMAPRCH